MVQTSPVFHQVFDRDSPIKHSNLSDETTQSDQVYRINDQKAQMKWWRDNWTSLDLIDPKKWGIFPGDVVMVTNSAHGK